MTDRGNADEARESEQRRLGEAVKIRRLVFDMSQNQLAVKAGLSVSVLGGIERGTEPLTARSIVKLAGALGWPADWPQAIRNGEDPETGNTTMFGASEAF